MITYVRVRTIKPGQFQAAINFLKDYKGFIQSETGKDIRFGTEVGRLGTVVSSSSFENAQELEEMLGKLRTNSNYVAMIDQSAQYFEDEVSEHLIMELPL